MKKNISEVLQPGMVVTVFCHPVTCEQIEGEATLIQFLDVLYNGLEVWEVEFENGDRVYRAFDPTAIITLGE